LFQQRRNRILKPSLDGKRDMRMASWLELILNIVGYGGFVVLASRHRGSSTPGASHEIGDGSSSGALPQ
jgi:hypothetical protein